MRRRRSASWHVWRVIFRVNMSPVPSVRIVHSIARSSQLPRRVTRNLSKNSMPLRGVCSDASLAIMNVHAGVVARGKPPFRAEHIGSLLRPKALLELRARFARGEISQTDLTTAEDAAISGAIGLQERVGLRFATDGEFRRRSYHSFFYQQLGELSIDTVAGVDATDGAAGAGRGQQPIALVKSRVKWTHPINVADFNFLKSRTRLLPKITIPGPCALHFRGGDAAVLAHAYHDIAQFWDDT